MANPSVHYVGAGQIVSADHAGCERTWEDIRQQHLRAGYNDVAYNFAACNHGHRLEGRGWGRDSAANGPGHNGGSRAICWLGGDADEPSAGALRVISEFAREAFARGLVPPLRPHSSYVPTSCCGDALRGWIDRFNAGIAGEEVDMTVEELSGLLASWEQDTRKIILDTLAGWEQDTRKQVIAHVDKRFNELEQKLK
jgi:hypothetical protein